jgi:CHAT domain-containing protein
MKLSQLPVKILLSCAWIFLATKSVHSQSGNMSDVSLPSPDAMIGETESGEEAPPTDEVTEEEEVSPTDEVAVEEATPSTEEITAEEETLPTDEVAVEEEEAPPTEEITAEEEEVPPTEEITAEEETLPTDEVTVEEEAPPTEEITAEEETLPTDEVAEEEEVPPTEEVTTEEETPSIEEITAEEETPPTDEVTVEEEEIPPTEEVTTEEETPSIEEITAEEEVPPTDEVAAEEETPPTDEVAVEEVPPTDEVATEEETPPTDEVTAEEETPSTEEVTAEEETPPTDEVTAEEETPSTEEITAEEETPPTEEITAEEETPSTEEITAEEETPSTEEITAEETTGTDSSDSTDDLTGNTAEDIVQEVQTSNTETNSIETNSDLETLDTASIGSEVLETEPPTLGETIEANKLAESNDIVKKLFTDADSREIQKSQETEEESNQEEDKTAEERNSEPAVGQLDRVAYETQFQEAPNDLAIFMQEEFQLTQLIGSSGIEFYGSVPSVKDISRRLAQLTQQTGKKPAFINISLQENQLESFVVLPEQEQTSANTSSPEAAIIRKTVKNTSREEIIDMATEFRQEIGDVRKLNQNEYKKSAQELYRVLIKPIEAELEANDIDVLVFSMDSGLRLLPVAALYDGKQFLVEKYALGMVPSFGLTDTRYVSPDKASILAMGASEFKEQSALPTMPIELKTIVSNPRRGESFLNEQFTINNFVAQNSRQAPFSIIHLGTHAEFKAGNLSDSYIQFHDERLKIPQLQKLSDKLGWNTSDTPIELLVLSACETALGDKDAELGFAGLAVQAGVKSTLASLWYVSDLGTLAMMGEFYDQLGDTLNKSEALRQTQIAMLRGNVKIDTQQVKLSNGTDLALPSDFPEGTLTLNHPYFWSSFALIGNWN